MRYFKTIAVGVTLIACGGVSSIGGGDANGGAGVLSGVVSGAGGAGGRAGTGGGPSGGPPPPDASVVGCDYVTALHKCATVGCHNANLPQANLNLVPDSGLVARLKDVPATFGDIACNAVGQPYMACVPATCPAGALEVSSADWTSSWVLRKLDDPNTCGDVMPPTGSTPPTPDDLTCLQKLVQTIAEMP